MFFSKLRYWEIVFSIRILKINTEKKAIILMIFILQAFVMG